MSTPAAAVGGGAGSSHHRPVVGHGQVGLGREYGISAPVQATCYLGTSCLSTWCIDVGRLTSPPKCLSRRLSLKSWNLECPDGSTEHTAWAQPATALPLKPQLVKRKDPQHLERPERRCGADSCYSCWALQSRRPSRTAFRWRDGVPRVS